MKIENTDCCHIFVLTDKIKQTTKIKLYNINCIKCDKNDILSIPFGIIGLSINNEKVYAMPMEIIESDYIFTKTNIFE